MHTLGTPHRDTLKTLTPLEAIRTWIGDPAAARDRAALAGAIQRDRRIELDDDEIAYLVEDGIETGLDARARTAAHRERRGAVLPAGRSLRRMIPAGGGPGAAR